MEVEDAVQQKWQEVRRATEEQGDERGVNEGKEVVENEGEA